ncbi:MAG: histidine phosphatase family protein, partial [Anaerolineae bacterium]|nr:histidine phosphatase family protein [Anaerolineae bacterium]
ESIVARSVALLDDLNQQHPGDESVLLVAHGQILRMLICVLLDIIRRASSASRWTTRRSRSCVILLMASCYIV